ncbi:MAG: carbonic anhydrase [Sporomusaceae bacterium]|nr:carbonic anhydrase [Sporomusaceae bacterium]
MQRFLAANRAFLAQNQDRTPFNHPVCSGLAQRIPCKELAIVTCIDTRLVQFLEPALGLSRGEATIIKNAGNIVDGPDSDVLRALVVAVFAQNCTEIAIIGHTDCGMARLNIQTLAETMRADGIEQEHTDAQALTAWLGGFSDEADNVLRSVRMTRDSGKIPARVPIHGLIMDINSGEIRHLLTL